MVVLGIAGLLLSLLLPRMASSRARAMQASCVSNERNIGTALQLFANDHDGRYPTGLDQLKAGTIPTALNFVPPCPTNGTPYFYVSNNEIRSYTIACKGIHYLQLPGIAEGYPQYYSTGQSDSRGMP